MRSSFIGSSVVVALLAIGCAEGGSDSSGVGASGATGSGASGGAGASGGSIGSGASSAGGHSSTAGTGGGVSQGGGGQGGGSPCSQTIQVTGVDAFRTAAINIYAGQTLPPLGGAAPDRLNLEFYAELATSPITGAIDLAAGENVNYGTCSTCVLAVQDLPESESDPDPIVYFAISGTLDIGATTFAETDEDPHYIMGGSLTNAKLVEVVIDPDSFVSTPVPNGRCIEISNLPIDMTPPPAGWTCDAAFFNDGEICDCACGGDDPDCANASLAIEGCSANQMCVAGVCQ